MLVGSWQLLTLKRFFFVNLSIDPDLYIIYLPSCHLLVQIQQWKHVKMFEICSKLQKGTNQKDFVDVVLLFLLLASSGFHTLLWCRFHTLLLLMSNLYFIRFFFTLGWERFYANFKCKIIIIRKRMAYGFLVVLGGDYFAYIHLTHFRLMFHLCRNQLVGFY